MARWGRGGGGAWRRRTVGQTEGRDGRGGGDGRNEVLVRIVDGECEGFGITLQRVN